MASLKVGVYDPMFNYHFRHFPSPPVHSIWAMMFVWRIREKIVTTVLCCIMYYNSVQWYSHTYEQFLQLSVGLGLGLLYFSSIACSATRRYLSYSEADFEVFRPAGVTRCTDGGEIWHGGVDLQNWNFYWDLIKMWNIYAPQRRIPCTIFEKFAEFVPRFRLY